MDTSDAITPTDVTTSRSPPARPMIIHFHDYDEHLYQFNAIARNHKVTLITFNAPSKKPLPTGLSKKTERLGKSLRFFGSKIKDSLGDKASRAKSKTIDILEQQSLEVLCTVYGISKLEHLSSRYTTNRDIKLPRFICTMLTYISRETCKPPPFPSHIHKTLIPAAMNTANIFHRPGPSDLIAAHYAYFFTYNPFTPNPLTACHGTFSPTIPNSSSVIASLFKRTLSTFPGGILGSLPLFQAIWSVSLLFDSCNEPGCPDGSAMQARMIAHAIRGVDSEARQDLIVGVLGFLAGYAGARSCLSTIAVDFGPVLLGDLTPAIVAVGAWIDVPTSAGKKVGKGGKGVSAQQGVLVEEMLGWLLRMWQWVVQELNEVDKDGQGV